MKLKKWLATILAAVMAVGALGAFAACGDKETTTPPPGGGGGGNGGGGDDTAIQYYLVGSGLGTLAISNWDQTNTDETLKFTRTGNTAVITADLYEGDEFGIIHNQDWAGQMGGNILDNEGKDAEGNQIFEASQGGGAIPNIKVVAGQSGKYELTLTINSESAFEQNLLTWKVVDKYDVAFATWFDIDDVTQLGKTVVKKGATPASFTYEKPIKSYYEFDKWVTKVEDEDTDFDFTTGTISEDTSFYARIKETANDGYKLDSSKWEIKENNKAGKKLVELARASEEEYKVHNVFIGTYEFAEGDKFAITNGTVANVEMTGMESSRVFEYSAEYFTVLQAGNYQFTLVTEGVDKGDPTVKVLRADKIADTFTGYAIIGPFADANWSFVNGVSITLTETGEHTNVFKATLVVTDDMLTCIEEGGVQQTTPNFPFKVSYIEKDNNPWTKSWGDSGNSTKPQGNSEPGVNDNYWITKAGTYTITLDMNANGGNGTMTVVSAATEYIFVGKWLAAQGNGGLWGYDGSNPKLTETEPGSGIYEGTITTDIANAEVKVCSFLGSFSWDAPNWGTEKDGSQLSGDNVALAEIGTYKFTLNVAENKLTWQKVEA